MIFYSDKKCASTIKLENLTYICSETFLSIVSSRDEGMKSECFINIFQMKYLSKILFIIALSTMSTVAFSQKYAAGGSVMYNLQTESVGFGIRGNLYPNRKWSFVPQISYYPSFNLVHEYTLGLGIEYKIIRQRKFFFYLLGHGGYNKWINYEESPMKDAKPNNFNLEGGLGVSMYSCIRPFLECRYNANFREAHLQLGVLYVFGCRSNSNPGSNGSIFSKGRRQTCPGYGNY